MDFFLEIHNGECGLGGLFCDHQRDHGPSVLTVTGAMSSHLNLFRHGRTQNPEPGTQNPEVTSRNLTRRVHSPNYDRDNEI